MTRGQRIARNTAVLVGSAFCGIGALHGAVTIRWLLRAAGRGQVAERLVPQLVANVAFAGIAIALPGLILLLVSPELARGKRLAARLTLGSGLFFVAGGLAGYVWRPIPSVLLFTILGAVVCLPLVLWRNEFRAE
jgi:hypothetical protein